MTHCRGLVRQSYDGNWPKDVSMDEMDWLAERFESHRAWRAVAAGVTDPS